ncbi:hypothetical protein B0T16DRAFT_315504 [Cercophora newfieldiana]|uniref:Uncharacterized protein n=1 Tax=Cercophora newfieldiana TaxID=92897 RepID=A0AA39YNL2_9PEZI|nr:hypothetical protein B0T16DRAFT_315504 [Cercophora newfieldiana]
MNIRVARSILPILCAIVLSFVLFYAYTIRSGGGDVLHLPSIPFIKPKPTDRRPPTTHAPPSFKPTPTFTPAAVTDPFPLLATSTPPPIPEYNIPRPNLHAEYGLDRAPPLYIGFTRQWPMLLQAVVSYITAGWPADGIFVVENTGVYNSNRDGKLSLQNPFYLNHTTLKRLGVNVLQTPVLLTFAQLQNFFLHEAYEHDHPYYFYSHQDAVVFSFEDGPDNTHRPSDGEWDFYDENDKEDMMLPASARQPGYRTIYENCLRELNQTLERGERWGIRWFQYDHLSLVNREAMEAVGGYDSMIPYYISDCDFNGKLLMDGWTAKHRRVGIINDVSSVMTNLGALYRIPHITPNFSDPNPMTPEREAKIKADKEKAEKEAEEKKKEEAAKNATEAGKPAPARRDTPMPEDPVEYFRALNQLGIDMGLHKYRDKDNLRNTWQVTQRGGVGEPFYYDAMGFGRAFEILTEAGKGVYREKWGHRDCDLISGTALRMEDQWHVEKDWEKPKEEDKPKEENKPKEGKKDGR